VIGDRLHRHVDGNLAAPDLSGLSFGAVSVEFISNHAEPLRELSGWLGDDLSRRTLIGYLQARLTFDPGWLQGLYRPDQYFPSDLIALTTSERIVDAGAYDGDTIADFVARTQKRYEAIHAFEPDPRNFERLRRRVDELHLAHCDLHNAGTWEHTGTLRFRGDDARLSGIDSAGTETIRVEAIDDALGEDAVTFIKMDVEGAELMSLRGAQRSIARHRPILAICLYHRVEDLITIPAWIRQTLPEARLYLRLHTRHSQELVLYAVP